LSVDLNVLAERPPEHLTQGFIPRRGDPLGLLLERWFASKDYGVWHDVVDTGYEQHMATSASRC